MKFLLDIPLVMTLADWVWGNDRNTEDISAEICVSEFPLMKLGCWTGLIIKGLGIAIIAGSCLNRTPVMINILNSKTVEGISRGSAYGDAIVYANAAFYGLLEEHPFTAYGENIALLLQSLIIILLVWNFAQPRVGLSEIVITLLAATAYVFGVIYILPNDMHYILQTSVTPVYLYGRGSQIVETFRVKHTGAQSIATISMSLFGSLARILTTIKEVGIDLAVLLNFGLGVALNLTLFLMYFAYRSNTEKFLRDLQEKKHD